MSSLVTEALASAGSLAKDDWSTKISKLSMRAFDIKQELFDFTEQCYIDFIPLLSSSEQINSKLLTIKGEINNLQISLDTMVKNQIKDSTKEFENLSKEHTKTIRLVDVLEQLYLVHTRLSKHNAYLNSKHMLKAATELFEIEKLLNSLEKNILNETRIYKALRTEFIIKKENLLYKLDELWKDCVSITPQDGDDVGKLVINFNKKAKTVDSQDLVYAMNVSSYLPIKIKKLSKEILEGFLKPCILKSSFKPTVESNPEPALIAKCVYKENIADGDELPAVVFAKLQTVLTFLHEHLFKFQLSPSEDCDSTLMFLLRAEIGDVVVSLVIDHCLMGSIPGTNDQLQAYASVEEEVKNFELYLRQIRFLDTEESSQSSLLNFVSNIHIHFANQRCTAVLAKARALMKQEIYESVLIDSSDIGEIPENLFDVLRCGKQSKKSDLIVEAVSKVLKPSKLMNDNTFRLPRFRISRGVKEIVDLAYTTLDEAGTSTVECALRLVETTKNIFELFATVVPIHHKKSLASLPQVAALHYNDCWYIAHHLLTLGHQFSHHLPIKESDGPLTFVHQVPMIRQLGTDCFLKQMRRQRDILLECLDPLHKYSSNPAEDKFKIAEKPVKQVAHQLSHLKTVWSGVLPTNVLQTSLATLADCSINEVVRSVCALEDISSDNCTQLSTVCRLLQDEVSSLFNNMEESNDTPWQREVRKWQRLDELILVLDSNLRGIVDRWSDGKGPLAAVFTVVEVKGLVRALFQNTEQRANAISKIRY